MKQNTVPTPIRLASNLITTVRAAASLRGWLALTCLALAAGPAAQAANLTWTTNASGIADGPGTWNQASPSYTIGSGAWFDGSAYGRTMQSGDTVTFGGGASGAAGTVNNGTPLSPAMLISLTPKSGNYTIGTNGWNSAGTGSSTNNPLNMDGGTITNWNAGGLTISCPVNGSFTYAAATNSGFNCKVNFNGDGNQTATNIIKVLSGTLQFGANAGQKGSLGAAQIVLNNNAQLTWRRGSLAGGYNVLNAISGYGNVAYQLNSGTFTMLASQTYSGSTTFTLTGATGGSSKLKVGAHNIFPTNTDLYMNHFAGSANTLTFDLNGLNQTLGSVGSDVNATTSITLITGGATSTLTLAGTNKTRYFNGDIIGGMSLTMAGNGSKLTLSNACIFTGAATIKAGTLALGPAGAIDNATQVAIGAGGTFDVATHPAYTLSASSSLQASGAALPATIKGASGGSVSLGSQPITIDYDGLNPALTVSQAQLALNGNAFTVNGSPLGAGDYVIVTNPGNIISSSGFYTVNGTALFGTIGTIIVSDSTVTLHVVPVNVDPAKSTVTASPTTLPANDDATSTVTATIKDPSDQPIPGVGVNWTVTGSGNTVSPAAAGVTDGNGQVSFTVKSAKAETKLVTVAVGYVVITNALPLTFTVPDTGNAFLWDPAHTPPAGSNGSGVWDNSTANWAHIGADFAWPNNGNDTATFGTQPPLPAAYTVTLGSPITVGNMTFDYPAGNQYTIDGTNALTLAGTPTINTIGYALISAPLAGTGFIKTGMGTLRILNNNTNYTGDVTVMETGALQLGYNSESGNLGTGTITLADAASLIVRRQGTMLLNKLITGATAGGTVRFQLNGNGVVTVARANTYSAPTVLEPTGANASGTLKLGISDALPVTTDFTINTNGTSAQTLDLAGFNQTLDSLATAAGGNPTNAIITNSGETTSTLTVSGAGKTAFFGGRIAGKVNLTLNGSGSTLVLTESSLSTLTTVTVSNSATLQLDFTETNAVSGLVLNGAKKPAGVYSALTDSPYLAGTGSLLVRPVATNPTNITYSVTGSTLALSWPADHLGWSLQAQTNSLSIGIGTNWVTVPGSDLVTSTNLPINQANPAVFFRLKSP